jgi:hypothetical protein
MTTLDTLCEKLIKTYNTTIIDQMPYVLQQALYNDASSCSTGSYKQNEKDRTVLAELIHNHFAKKTQREELSHNYIGGPCTLTCHWSEQFQKLIYIFGEHHSEKTNCKEFPENYGKNEEQSGILIEKYLKKLTEINDNFLDIFIEIPAYKQKTLTYSNPLSLYGGQRLSEIGAEFSECMDAVSELNQTKCSRSRIHYIDVRNVEWKPGYVNELDPLSNFRNICFMIINSDSEDLNQKKKELSDIVNSNYGQYIMKGFLLQKDIKEYLEFWHGMVLSNSYVKKELYNCDKEMAEKIYDFTKKEIVEELDREHILERVVDGKTEKKTTSTLQMIQDVTKFINYYINNAIDPKIFIDQFRQLIWDYIIPINAAVVDCYTLCRIFKKFNLQPDNPEKTRTTDEPETPSNIIIYAGDLHCNRYRKFLKEIGFSLIADIGSNKSPVKNCINMTERDTKQPGAASGWSLQPLFSAWPPPTQPDFSPLPHRQQATLFGAFGGGISPQDTLFGGFSGGIPPQDTLFGGFVTPTPEKAKTKKEEIKNKILYQKELSENDIDYGKVGKMEIAADLKRKARKNTPY